MRFVIDDFRVSLLFFFPSFGGEWKKLRNVNNGTVCVMIRVYREKRNNSRGEWIASWNFERRGYRRPGLSKHSRDSFSKIYFFYS